MAFQYTPEGQAKTNFVSSIKKTPTPPGALVQATSTPDPASDIGKEEQDTPRPPEAAVEGGQVRFDDEKLIGNAFVMMGLAGA